MYENFKKKSFGGQEIPEWNAEDDKESATTAVFSISINFAFSRVSFKWHHIIYRLFRLVKWMK